MASDAGVDGGRLDGLPPRTRHTRPRLPPRRGRVASIEGERISAISDPSRPIWLYDAPHAVKADEWDLVVDARSPSEFEEVLNAAKWQPLTMRLRAKKETYNGNTRLKVHVVTPKRTDFVAEGNLMLKQIAKYDLPAADVKPDVKME